MPLITPPPRWPCSVAGWCWTLFEKVLVIICDWIIWSAWTGWVMLYTPSVKSDWIHNWRIATTVRCTKHINQHQQSYQVQVNIRSNTIYLLFHDLIYNIWCTPLAIVYSRGEVPRYTTRSIPYIQTANLQEERMIKYRSYTASHDIYTYYSSGTLQHQWVKTNCYVT